MKTSVACPVLLLAALTAELWFGRSSASGSPVNGGGDELSGIRDCDVPRGARTMLAVPWSSGTGVRECVGGLLWSGCDLFWPTSQMLTRGGTVVPRPGRWSLVSLRKDVDCAETTVVWSTLRKLLNRGAFRVSASRMLTEGGPALAGERVALIEKARSRFAQRMLRLALSPEFYGELSVRHGETASPMQFFLRAEYRGHATTVALKARFPL